MDNNASQSSSQTSLPTSMSVPQLTGLFSTDEAVRKRVADDYGHYIHRQPLAVLQPRSADDVVRIVQFARRQGLKIAPRGQGHSAYGQAQVEGGIVVDTTSLKAVHALYPDRIEVEAGVRMDDLLKVTLEQALTLPVLTDYLGLSLGGVLSVGGVGASSYQYGALVDHVLELQVVTGEGRLETCSPNQQPQLFESVLAGLGQYGIILQATIRLIPAKVNARVFRLFYPTLAALVQDEAMVTRESDGRFDAVLGYVVVTPQNEWGYMLEVATFYASLADQPDNNRLLSDLGFLRGMEQIEETTYFNFRNRVDAVVTAFKEMGVWDYAHPWFDVFIPTPAVVDYVNNVLATTSPAESQLDTILLYPFNANRFSRPLLRLPDAESFFLFDLLRTRPPDSEVISQVIAHNRVLFEQSRKLGGMHYPIGMIDLSQKDWETHYGSCWEQVVQMKQRFDPDHLLTPSQGIFPS